MAQLPYIEPEQADPVTKGVYDKVVARFQMVLNIFKITGNAPEVGSKMWEIFFEILQDGHVDWPTKELLILKATKMGDCLYCVTQHEVVSERLGVSATIAHVLPISRSENRALVKLLNVPMVKVSER